MRPGPEIHVTGTRSLPSYEYNSYEKHVKTFCILSKIFSTGFLCVAAGHRRQKMTSGTGSRVAVPAYAEIRFFQEWVLTPVPAPDSIRGSLG